MMSDGPKAGAKWSKYAVKTASLSENQNSALGVDPAYFLQFTLTANLVEGVDIQKKSNDFSFIHVGG